MLPEPQRPTSRLVIDCLGQSSGQKSRAILSPTGMLPGDSLWPIDSIKRDVPVRLEGTPSQNLVAPPGKSPMCFRAQINSEHIGTYVPGPE
jgi:hypothetical protein